MWRQEELFDDDYFFGKEDFNTKENRCSNIFDCEYNDFQSNIRMSLPDNLNYKYQTSEENFDIFEPDIEGESKNDSNSID